MNAAGRRDSRRFARRERMGGNTEYCWLNLFTTVTGGLSPESRIYAATVSEIAGRAERQ